MCDVRCEILLCFPLIVCGIEWWTHAHSRISIFSRTFSFCFLRPLMRVSRACLSIQHIHFISFRFVSLLVLSLLILLLLVNWLNNWLTGWVTDWVSDCSFSLILIFWMVRVFMKLPISSYEKLSKQFGKIFIPNFPIVIGWVSFPLFCFDLICFFPFVSFARTVERRCINVIT